MSDHPDGRITTTVHGRVFAITIDRPAKYNGFTPKMLHELADAYTKLERDPDLWVGVLAAEGKHFTAGLELSKFDITDPLIRPDQIDPLDLHGVRRSKPVVAAVHGICFT